MNENNDLFDFVVDQNFKECLLADYKELKSALGADMYKSVLILAGSIVEALLVDYLIFTEYKSRNNKDPLKMDLWQAIDAATADGVLSSRTASLCNVLREYRNIIHPGRMVRKGEKADKSIAKVAEALLETVIKDIAEKRHQNYGYTAEQIASKIQSDRESLQLLHHIMRDCPEHEIERLLLEIIPERYSSTTFDCYEYGYDPSSTLDALSKLFDFSFNKSSETTKKKVMTRYATIVREESGVYIQEYEDAFGKSLNLDYANFDIFDLLVDRMKLRLQTQISIFSLGLVASLPRNAKTVSDMIQVIDPIANAYVMNRNLRSDISDFMLSCYLNTKKPQSDWVIESLENLVQDCLWNNNESAAALIKESIMPRCATARGCKYG
jgi:hypothetical protein